ncbi:protein FLX-like 1 [Chenopodium quinoa]|uniref:protein FLX-like 1 n=1 Tax=Chenopodium quinoa TaxID=63459 RepID=UPI000B7834A3|nr:protein FLX-like 1 [Chenopodium quinoa]
MAGRQPHSRAPPPSHMTAHHREIQGLLLDQKEMSAMHATLKQELAAADQELRKLSAAARKFREERESQIKELYEKSLKLETEVRAIEALNSEHTQVIGDIQKLTESKIQLTAQFKVLDTELSRVKMDASQVPEIQADVDKMEQELQKGRAAVEYEKKTRAANLELNEAMDRKMNSLQHDIEMLRAELANAEKRAREAAAASNPDLGYTGNYESRSMAYGRGPYSVQYSMHQGQLMADSASLALYGRSVSHDPFDAQQPHVRKG